MRELLIVALIVLPMSGWAWTNIDPAVLAMAYQVAGGKGGHGGRGAPGPSAQSGPSAPQAGEPARGEPSGTATQFPPVLMLEPVPQPQPTAAPQGPSPQYLPQYATLSIPVRVAPQSVLQVMPGYQLGGWVQTDRGWMQLIQPQQPRPCP